MANMFQIICTEPGRYSLYSLHPCHMYGPVCYLSTTNSAGRLFLRQFGAHAGQQRVANPGQAAPDIRLHPDEVAVFQVEAADPRLGPPRVETNDQDLVDAVLRGEPGKRLELGVQVPGVVYPVGFPWCRRSPRNTGCPSRSRAGNGPRWGPRPSGRRSPPPRCT